MVIHYDLGDVAVELQAAIGFPFADIEGLRGGRGGIQVAHVRLIEPLLATIEIEHFAGIRAAELVHG